MAEDYIIWWTPVWVAGDPLAGSLEVGPYPDWRARTASWMFLDGPFKHRRQCKTKTGRLLCLMTLFHTLVVRDGLDPQRVHQAFLRLPEYRQTIAPDCPRKELSTTDG